MENQINRPAPQRFWTWFNPFNRETGGWAFILNRITALGLTLYLFMHLVVLGTLARGPEAYGTFMAIIEAPIFKIGELLVVAAAIMHGLNGIRIILTSFGIGIPSQKQTFWIFMVISAITTLFFAIRMFS